MDFTTANLIQSTYPANFDTDIPVTVSILVNFIRDMDPSTFTDATVGLEIVGTIARIPVSISYVDGVLTITPSTALQPLTSYQLTIVGDVTPAQDVLTSNITGIRDILGNGMVGIFKTIFTTDANAALNAPTNLSPIPQTAVLSGQPTFSWTSVSAATGYQIQVATSNTFEDIVFPTDPSTFVTTQTSLTPGTVLTTGNEYWWKVRAVTGAGYSAWSTPFNFYYGDPTQGYVSPQDNPFGLLPPGVQIVKVLSTYPIANTNNIVATQFPDHVSVVVNAIVNPGTVDNTTFWIEGNPIDGLFNSGEFKPIFSPSLNGAIYQAGGITAPSPVDAYQQIMASGIMQSDEPPQISADSTGNTTLTLHIPAGYMQDNNLYTVHLSIPELTNPVKFNFTSQWFPAFTSPQTIRYYIDHFLPNITDEELFFHIRRNSLNAIYLQVYPPTQQDGEQFIYQPPVSFDVSNPPYFVREYVRLQTVRDLLVVLLATLLRSGRITLGDLTVDKEMPALKAAVEYTLQQVDKELNVFLDNIHGHHNRGWGRGDWAGRGDRLKNWSNPAGYQFPPRGLQF